MSKNSLYISVVQYNNQLKIDYKQFENGGFVQSQQSSFLIQNNLLPQDAISKLNALEQTENNTYISTLSDNREQRIVPKNRAKHNDSVEISPLNSRFDVVLDKSALFETRYFFERSGIDYIYSPFHILNLHCEQNPSENAINGLILNNNLYLVILDARRRIVHSSIELLPTFNEIQKTNFYENEISGQKLFDEIYYFQVEHIINSVLKEFYKGQDVEFVSKATILHSVKQLNDEQIKHLHKELLIEINYHGVVLDDYIYELAKQNKDKQKSFIQPRKKKKSKFFLYLFLFLSLLVTSAGFWAYNNFVLKKQNIKENSVEKKEIKSLETKKILKKLPNHKARNKIVEKELKSIFEYIPYSVFIEELNLDKDGSRLKIAMIEEDIYTKELQAKFLKLYKDSSMVLENKKPKEALKAIVENKTLLIKIKENISFLEYKVDFIPKQQVEKKIFDIFKKNILLSAKPDKKADFLTMSYEVVVDVKEPSEFFSFLDKINQETHSINIAYPINIKKENESLKITFVLEFNQNID